MTFNSCMIVVLAAGLGKIFLKASGGNDDLKMINDGFLLRLRTFVFNLQVLKSENR